MENFILLEEARILFDQSEKMQEDYLHEVNRAWELLGNSGLIFQSPQKNYRTRSCKPPGVA